MTEPEIKITPLGERVLIKPKEKEERTSGGIYLPEDSQENKKEGQVLAVGKTKEGQELPLQKGDRILYGGYSNEEFEMKGKKYLIIEFKDIIAKLE